MTVRDAREQWLKERPQYERLCKAVEKIIKAELRLAGIVAIEVVSRPKDPDSLLRKIIRLSKTYDEVTDKAAARVVVQFRDELGPVCEVVENIFPDFKKDDKTEELKDYESGYQAIHYDVVVSEGNKIGGDLEGLKCEIQVRTLCQDLWAVMSHSLSYKAVLTVPPDLKRQINLLSAAMEIADRTFLGIQTSIGELVPATVLSAVTSLERHFYRLTGRQFDLGLTHESVVYLLELYEPPELATVGKTIEDFVAANSDKLSHVFDKYSATENRPFFLFQPEVILVFDRLVKDNFRLAEHWNAKYPPEELEDLAIAWGTPLP